MRTLQQAELVISCLAKVLEDHIADPEGPDVVTYCQDRAKAMRERPTPPIFSTPYPRDDELEALKSWLDEEPLDGEESPIVSFNKVMTQSIDQRVEALRTNLAYTPPEMWSERFQECKLELKTHLEHNLHETGLMP